MFPQHSPPPPGLAHTSSQDVFPNDISGLLRWCNDSCEECFIPERSGNSISHRLAATLHKAHCWNTDFNLWVSLKLASVSTPCPKLAVLRERRKWELWWGSPYNRLLILPCQPLQILHWVLWICVYWTTNVWLKVAVLQLTVQQMHKSEAWIC